MQQHVSSVKLSLNMKDISTLTKRLQNLGVGKDEADIFLRLLEMPQTRIELSRATGIVRSNVYRIVDGMTQKGLVCEQTTSAGKLLVSVEPEALEVLVVEQETTAQMHRDTLTELLPMLKQLRNQSTAFGVKTYSGLGGFKQMFWNELRSSSEILLFSCDPLQLATGQRWAEKYRTEVIRRGLRIRGIENLEKKGRTLTDNIQYEDQHYHARYLPEAMLTLKFELSIHDDTISIYNQLVDKIHVGTEIHNPFLAAFMRQIFEQYWALAVE